MKPLLILNLLVALTSTAFGAVSALRPAVLSNASDRDQGEIFYSRMYAVRAIPFGLLVGSLPFFTRGAAVVALLLLAALIQLLDGVIGVMRKDLRQLAGPLIATIVHAIAAWRCAEVARFGGW